ncbi:fimbrial protein [Caballeronia sp. DA-9]|uniref:fimbrial protein n=1 Tax=Caballeronia sp. DA-9 TaxID=3436237 RepID=UPI003F672CDA
MWHKWLKERSKRTAVWIKVCGSFVLTSCIAPPVFADCNVYGGGPSGIATITLPANLNIARDAIGTILFDSNWVATTVVRPNCSGTGTITAGYLAPLVPVPGQANVYKTGVDGIGIKVGWLNTVVNVGSYSIDGGKMVTSPASNVATYIAGLQGNMGYFRAQLIKVGPISAGNFNLPVKLANGVYGSAEINALQLVNNTASVVAPACSIQDSIKSVTMPVGSGRYLSAVGSTTGDTGFSISLNCPTPVSISMTFTDATNPDNVGTTLSLSSDSTAKGVGYQILYTNKVINYGPDSSIANNVNQFSVAPAGTVGALIIPFIARYVRTGAITPGSANAKATFTMSYQ